MSISKKLAVIFFAVLSFAGVSHASSIHSSVGDSHGTGVYASDGGSGTDGSEDSTSDDDNGEE
ncbi:hypothetical protein E6B08_14445 [Pseudomonas putida]|uniref:Uncharacterized protein n=1 Tax=Pseudomonas putida TaxID=303 RepID=A0A4D6XDT5_PSEPU|nr:hypothetical protein [Pseudomonas putida]QCI12491.1 hypothetical protein E6B08_14445 [Pseudomonas putida]